MLLGFQRRFADFIIQGSKTHTIRGIRKIPPMVGEIAHCYVDPRQKTMRLLGRWPVVKVEDIRIDINGANYSRAVSINGHPLDTDEIEALAFRDGFRDFRYKSHFEEMMKFWDGRLPFRGQIIHWDFSRPVGSSRLDE